jgi:hypothetical protein
MRTNLLTRFRGAEPLAVRPAWSGRDNLAGVFAAAGTLLLPVAMFLPWYRDIDIDGGTLSAWGGYWFVPAEMLLLFLAGAWLALSILAGRPLRRPAVTVVIGFAFVVTITVVIALFIARPGGNAGTAVAFGGYVGLAAIGTIKGGAVVMAASTRERMTSGRALALTLRPNGSGDTPSGPAPGGNADHRRRQGVSHDSCQ